MARSVFRLATLLKLRDNERDERRLRLAEAHAAEMVLRERIQQYEQQLSALGRDYHNAASPGKVDVDRLLDSQRYEAILRGEKASVEGQCELIRAEVEKRREALVVADRDVRSLEKLRDAQRLRYDQRQQLTEIKQLDEVASRLAFVEDGL